MIYNPKSPLWMQMPFLADFNSNVKASEPGQILQWHRDFLQNKQVIIFNNGHLTSKGFGPEINLNDGVYEILIQNQTKPVTICHIVSDACWAEINLRVESDCEIIEHIFASGAQSQINTSWDIADSVKAKHALHCYGGSATCLSENRVKLNTNAVFDAWRICHSGAWLHEHTHCDLFGSGAAANIRSLVLAFKDNNCQTAATFKHIGKSTTSKHKVTMLVGERAKGVCYSDVEVCKEATGSYSEQFNNNLALADTAEIATQPRLCINNEQVVCSHGATTGELDLEMLQYMFARGIGVQEAYELVIKGFVHDLLAESPELDWTDIAMAKLNTFEFNPGVVCVKS